MIKNNIIIAFSSDKICSKIINILKKNGINYDYVFKTGANLRKALTIYENAIILCGTDFVDEPTYQIIQDFYEDFTFLLLGNLDKINIFPNHIVYKIPTPIKQEDIINSIYIAYYKNEEKYEQKKIKYIQKAKQILIETQNFSEQQAHKYIQQKSMDAGKKNIHIAKAIIKRYENKG